MCRLKILQSTINSYLVIHDNSVNGITLYIKKNNSLDVRIFNAFSSIIRDIPITSCHVDSSIMVEAMPYYIICNHNGNVSFNLFDNTPQERNHNNTNILQSMMQPILRTPEPLQNDQSNFIQQMLNTVLRTPQQEGNAFLIPLPNNINESINSLLNSDEDHEQESKEQLHVYQPNNSEEKDVYVSSPFTVQPQVDDRKMAEIKEHSVREQILEQVIASIIRHVTIKRMHPPNFTLTTVKNRRKIKNFVHNISGINLNESEIKHLITYFTNNPISIE